MWLWQSKCSQFLKVVVVWAVLRIRCCHVQLVHNAFPLLQLEADTEPVLSDLLECGSYQMFWSCNDTIIDVAEEPKITWLLMIGCVLVILVIIALRVESELVLDAVLD